MTDWFRSLCGLLVLLVGSRWALTSDETQFDFDRRLAPLLAARCLDCHAGLKPEGGLDLSKRDAAFKGGESGKAIAPGQLDKSLFWQRIAADEMPPKHPLSDAEKAVFKKWIESGAEWGSPVIDRFKFTTDRRAGYDWWSLQPVKQPALPDVQDAKWSKNDIDRFVLKTLETNGLKPSQAAAPRVLLRRVYFDLIGLPPTPEEVAEFERDPSDARYAAVVESLLNSTRYGERWARHWLDVVRYGESNGFERNAERTNFWQYRDWVIEALNADLPYDQFVKQQLAGDALDPGPRGAAASGFMVAGVHNTVVGGSERMKKLAVQDELEEVIGTIGQTFLGLTVQCGRCHDHKFDPVSATDYYRMIATIQGAAHGDRDVRAADAATKIEALAATLKTLQLELQQIEQQTRAQILEARKTGKADAPKPPQAFAQWEFESDFKDSIGSLHGKPINAAKLEGGALVVDGNSYVETAMLAKTINEKTLAAWVQVDGAEQRGGGIISLQTLEGGLFDAIVYAENEPKRWMAGSNFFRRTQPFKAPDDNDAASKPVHVAIVYQADGTIVGYRNGQPYGSSYKSVGVQPFEAGKSNVIFGLRHAPLGGNKQFKGRILQAALYDRALAPDAVAAAAGTGSEYVSEEEIVTWLKGDAATKRSLLKSRVAELTKQQDELQKSATQKVYAVISKQPGPTHVLVRGDVDKLADVALPGGVASLGANADFGLSANSNDHERRRKLADWITHPENPLFARVIANRLWHYHFGTGIVETPNDFGFNGGRPSHPQLLDWLADRLRADGYRMKSLHRLMVTSSTYRQLSLTRADGLTKDAGNRFLWRMTPRRLEAEAIRDATLVVAGKLNLKMGGPSVIDVSITPNNGTTYYEPLDVDGDEFFRRTVYRFNPRGGRSALLDTFDCPDPSATAPRRQVTTTPLQALSLLNNAFVLRMANYSAERTQRDSGEKPAAQVQRLWQLAYGRSAEAREEQLAVKLIEQHGLAHVSRAVFNSNEFVIIE